MLFGGRADSMTRRAVPLPQRNLMLYDNASKTQRGLNERKKTGGAVGLYTSKEAIRFDALQG